MPEWGIEVGFAGGSLDELPGANASFTIDIQSYAAGRESGIDYALFAVRLSSGYATPLSDGITPQDVSMPASVAYQTILTTSSGLRYALYRANFSPFDTSFFGPWRGGA